MSKPVSKAPVLGEQKEGWLTSARFTCVRCRASYKTRDELMAHYDSTRHDKYSAWK
jgi:hypothetical protein